MDDLLIQPSIVRQMKHFLRTISNGAVALELLLAMVQLPPESASVTGKVNNVQPVIVL